jgi:hypothetical protein
MNDDDLFVQACMSWLAVRTTDMEAVVSALQLQNVSEGDFSEWGYDEPPNTFLYVAQDQWVIVYHRWQHTGELEASATGEEIGNAVYTADVNLLNKLSEQFGEAQSFGFDEEYVGYAHWALSKNGSLERYFKWSSEDEEPGHTVNIGDPTEAESFIDWATLDDWEVVEEEEEESCYEYNGSSFGCVQVLKIAHQWSVNPVHDEHPEEQAGILGDGQISIV